MQTTNSQTFYDVIIIGGGLAGLCNAIHLAKAGKNVCLFEKNDYPKHKVCGEYISNEILPYLKFLGFNPFDFGAVKIDQFTLTSSTNKAIHTTLPLGGFGISRFTLDNELAKLATEHGVKIIKDIVIDVTFSDDEFTLSTKENKNLKAKIVIGAYGKRANLDKQLNREFIQQKSPYLAVKTHVEGNFPSDLIALHNFEGGYCGASLVENGYLNLCYIVDYKSFKKYKDIDDFQKNVVFKNKALKQLFTESEPVFERSLTISQISFDTKQPVENHMIMCGDTAGMIHPLCGNGMSMAIRSAQMASTLILNYFNGSIASRSELEDSYSKQWKKAFSLRLKVGHIVAGLFKNNFIATLGISILKPFPKLLSKIISLTHGKPISLK